MIRAGTLVFAAPLLFVLAACDAPTPPPQPRSLSRPSRDVSTDGATLASQVRQLAAGRGIVAMPAAPMVRRPLVVLGQALAFDKTLSGPRDISCMTCHLPAYATGDGKSVSVGEGGIGLGPTREHPQGVFIPRNAPPLFNLHVMRRLFLDGRVEVDASGHFHTPAGVQLSSAMTRVFEFGAASAQPLFPPTSRAEMRGMSGNELAALPDTDLTGIWKGIMTRLGKIPEYRAMFEAAYPGTKFDDMNFAYASNAIAGFMVSQLAFNNTPWDRFLRGNDTAMTTDQLLGAQTFLSLKCSICHNGAALSDQQFHDVAVAQIGPGEEDGLSGHDDFGRNRVTGLAADVYRFRTTPLRNVELTGPYGHDGAIINLRDFIAHYSNSDLALLSYNPFQLEPLLQTTLQPNATDILAQRDTLLKGVVLSDDIIDRLTTYMHALTDPAAVNLSRLTPQRVPSGLSIDK